MKIRIEGCTAEDLLADQYEYLSVGKVYEVERIGGHDRLYRVIADDGIAIETIVGGQTAHLPKGGYWVEVPSCEPTAEDLKLIADGDYCAEELWGGPRPTCPECIEK